MGINSLKEDFLFFISDNSLSHVLQITEDNTDKKFEFETSFSVSVSTEIETRSENGVPKAGQRAHSSQEAERKTEDQIRELISSDIDRVSTGNSQFLRKKDASRVLTTDDFYVVQDCQICSNKGKVPCESCGAKGQITCRGCSGAGRVECSSCSGYGNSHCATCSGIGKVAEYNRSMQDDLLDTLHKNYGGPVYRRCNSCNGEGRKTCLSCGGNKTRKCSSCGGNGTATCNTCNGSTKVTCSACAGHGCNSNITNRSALLRSSHENITFSQINSLAQSCLQRSCDDFLDGSTFQDINAVMSAGEGGAKWSIGAHTQYEDLSVVNAAGDLIKVGRLSSNNTTFSSTGFLDEELIRVASDALSKVSSISQFKERVSEFPGVIRWAFGEKVQSPRHAVIRPMYDALLSEEGKQSIVSLKSGYLKKAQDKLYWPFFIFTAPACIGVTLFLIQYFEMNMSDIFTRYASIGGSVLIAHFLAEFLSLLYVSRASKI